jgi:hypothetical protein
VPVHQSVAITSKTHLASIANTRRVSYGVAQKEPLMITPYRTVLVSALVLASFTAISAHQVRSVSSSPVKAFVSSPTSADDAPIAIQWVSPTTPPTTYDTGLRVVCFFVANPSQADPARSAWPRITSVGFELPGAPSGFALVEPSGGDWRLHEDVQAKLMGQDITLDFTIVADLNPTARKRRPKNVFGIPPGQPDATRGTGTRFCVSGPFPAQLTRIEEILDGVVVGFHGVQGAHRGIDAGVWLTQGALRPIPLY